MTKLNNIKADDRDTKEATSKEADFFLNLDKCVYKQGRASALKENPSNQSS